MNTLLRALILSFALIAVCGNAALHEHDAQYGERDILVCELCTLADGSAVSKPCLLQVPALAMAESVIANAPALYLKSRQSRPYATGPPC